MTFQRISRRSIIAVCSGLVLLAAMFIGGVLLGRYGGRPPSTRPATLAEIVAAQSKPVSPPPSVEAKRLQALTALQRAVGEAQHIGDEKERVQTLCTIAAYQACAGDPRAAIQTAEAFEQQEDRDGALTMIAEPQARDSDLPGALRTVERIRNQGARIAAVANVAKRLARRGDLTEALRVADGLNQEGQGHFTYMAYDGIVEGLAKRGDVVAAIHTVERFPPDWDKDSALAHIAVAQARAHDLPAAMETVQTIQGETSKRGAFRDIAQEQARKGDHDAALLTLQSIKDDAERSEGLWSIINDLEFAGDVEGVQKVIAALQPFDPDHDNTAKAALMGAHAWAGHGAAAVRILEGIADPKEREGAWSSLACVQAARGDVSDALKSLEKAGSPGPTIGNAVPVSDIAFAQYLAGHAGADEIIETLPAGLSRTLGFEFFANALLQDVGRIDRF